MLVRRLQIASFRTYQALDLTLDAGNLLFLGRNAQGKSNLLEAVHLLATAKSARTSVDSEVVSWQSEDEPRIARVYGVVERRAGLVQLEAVITAPATGLAGQASRAGKRLRVNGIPRRAIDLVGQLRAVLFTANDLDIVSGPPSERRRYLDAALTQRDRRYYAASQRYARVLQHRNAALRRVKDGLAGPEELVFWDEAMAREAAVIVRARLVACERLSALAADVHRELSGEAREELSLAYQARLGPEWERLLSSSAGEAEIEKLIATAVVAQRRRELAAGVSLLGPHRDDVALSIGGASAAAYGSRAQIRTAALALRLAEARLLAEDIDDPPVLLLDDIVSELDEGRRASVLKSIADFGQVWFTATDAHGLPDSFLSSAKVYTVDAGTISPE